jgi:hypothetical protein
VHRELQEFRDKNFLSEKLPPSNSQAILHLSQQIQGNNPPFTPTKERGFIQANKSYKMPLADACHSIETNEPPIIYHASIEFRDGGIRLNSGPFFDLGDHEYNDVAGWRRLGRAIGNNSNIDYLRICAEISDASVQPAATCHREFYNELKHSTSIQSLRLHGVSKILPSFDLGYFLRNSSNKKNRSLDEHIISDLDAAIISSAIEGAQLRRFYVGGSSFGNDGVFQQISSACLGVEYLDVTCRTNSNCSALAALLRDPRAILQHLLIRDGPFANLSAIREIAASLVGNTKLIELGLGLTCPLSWAVVDEFNTMLCNASSIEDICNSNHTLEKIDIDSFCRTDNFYGTFHRINNHLLERTREYLKINENENKQKVIQNKLIQYFFVESFDVTPFAKMPFSVLARLISCGVGMSNQLHFIFCLLRNIPDFVSNVSSRSAKNLDLEC